MPTSDAFQQSENQATTAGLPPSGDSHKWKKMGGARKRKTSVDIIICYSVTLFASFALEIGLNWLHVNMILAAWIVSFCMVLFPLAYALTRGKRILFALNCIVIWLASIIPLPAQSITLFIGFYTAFLLLGLFVALSVRIDGR